MFNKTDELFTYIVPSNEAWEDINHQFASAYKILFMGAFAYQVNTIKIIDDWMITIFKFHLLSNNH